MNFWDIALNLLLLVLGFVLLSKGSDFFVDGAASIATRFKIPQLVIGLTVVAMGTSLPEAAVSVSAALKGTADITVGNVVGSNILNVLIILGISAVITPLAVAPSTLKMEIPIMLGASLYKMLKYVLYVADGVTSVDGLKIGVLLVGMTVAFAVSLASIKFLMDFVKRHSFTAFGIYRIVLGVIVIGELIIRSIVA
jgi:cation:H+ antiporter